MTGGGGCEISGAYGLGHDQVQQIIGTERTV